MPSVNLSNRFLVFASFSTSPSRVLECRCCIDRLNSQQKLALEALGEFEKAAVVDQRLEAQRREMLDSVKDYNPATERLIFSNPSLFSAYLAAVRSDGEVAARARIAKDIKRLLEQQPELVCQPI